MSLLWLPNEILLRIYQFCDEKSKLCLSQSCPELYNMFSVRIWEEDLYSKFGEDWEDLFERAFHRNVDACSEAAKLLGYTNLEVLLEAQIYRLLTDSTKMRANAEPKMIGLKAMKAIEFCDICERFALIRGDIEQHKAHFSHRKHKQIEEKTFQRIFLAAGKLCLMCKRDVIFITGDELTQYEVKSYHNQLTSAFMTVNCKQPSLQGQFAVYDCRDVICANCVRKRRTESLWEFAKVALLPEPDFKRLFLQMFEIITKCPVCGKSSNSIIPSRFHIWAADDKVKLKIQYKKQLQRQKCRFEMRSRGLWFPFSDIEDKGCPFAFCQYRHKSLDYPKIDITFKSAVFSILAYLIGPGVCTSEPEANRRNLCSCLQKPGFPADYYLGPLIHQRDFNDFDFLNMFVETYSTLYKTSLYSN